MQKLTLLHIHAHTQIFQHRSGSPKLHCTEWPSSPSYTCTGNNNQAWVKLDSALGESDYTICKELCTKQGPGCCFLSNAGCAWTAGGSAKFTEDSNAGIAITCTHSGKYGIIQVIECYF